MAVRYLIPYAWWGPYLETDLNVPLPTRLIWFPEKKSLLMNLIPLREFASKLVRLLSFRWRTRTRPVLGHRAKQ